MTDTTLKAGQLPVKVLAGIYGPLPPGTFRLLTRRSSLSMKGIIVHLGIIDSDYKGEIQIMMSAQ